MEITIPVAFFFGILSFFSPCLLPLVPGYLSTFSDTKVHNMYARFTGTCLFVLGFSIVFIGLATVASSFGSLLYRNLSSFKIFSGVIIIYFGLSLIYPKLQYNFQFQNSSFNSFNLYTKNIFLGFSFAFGFTPCIGPVLGALLTLSSSTANITDGITLLTLYSFGMGVPFILSSLIYDSFSLNNHFFKLLTKNSSYISGVTLISIGVLIASDKIYIISSFIQDLFNILGLEFLSTI